MATVVAHLKYEEISSFPYERLQRFSDLASAFRLYVTCELQAFKMVASAIGRLEGQLDALLKFTHFDECGPEARVRSALEDAQFRLNMARRLFEASASPF